MISNFIHSLPPVHPGILIVGAAIVLLVAYQLLRRVLRVVWAARMMLGLLSVLGVGGFTKGCTSASTNTASLNTTAR